ncbi:lactate racemase domain-containing protein [Aporhodopirellula aestuarii]|uniref:Lactate racemase domain-containing protein n=1 Tax=Aporhodopirellula aestuarii TaxID=2950107 RepID=A0ABT0U7P7_9BACT|nr:lactate racemase domain-containing protein [Aporhodopirellula aestuarii]MCM2372901.1 lactate racemase domain-containing protein [Aporhodopirellula aestuarii]
MTIYYANGSPTTSLTNDDLREALKTTFDAISPPKKVLLLPPDQTRLFSRAGELTVLSHELLGDRVTDIMPALGTHSPMTPAQLDHMFPGVPHELFRPHRWRDDVVQLGEVPADFVSNATNGVYTKSWPAEVNRLLRDGQHDLIFSIGQVVPHEVIGMANYNKNVFVGTGGVSGINESHYLSAMVGIDQTLGIANTPLRQILNYAQDHFCQDMPLLYALTVIELLKDGTKLTRGLYIGDDHETFFAAAELSRQVNITHLPRAPKHVVAYLDPSEFKSTWLGNKAIYRTRKAIATGGRLTVLGPAVEEFGEDKRIDQLIRKYGYRTKNEVMQLVEEHEDLAADPSAAAHLVHGSPENRFDVVYAAGKLTDEEIRSVGFIPGDLNALLKRYDINTLQDGFHEDVDGTEFYFVQNPALGLWEAPLD